METKLTPTLASVSLVTKLFYEYQCGVEIVGKIPTPEELDGIAHGVYGLADGGDYEPDPAWDLHEAIAEVEDQLKDGPHFRATWKDDKFEIEVIEDDAEFEFNFEL